MRRRPLWWTVSYVALSVVGVFGLAWYVASSLGFVVGRGISRIPAGARVSSSTRDTFEELYQLGWRADGDAGNTAVEVVYYYPALVQALSAYAERSLTQAQTLQELQRNEDQFRHPFLVRLERNVAFDQAWPLQENIQLAVDGTMTFPVERWQAFADPSGSAKVLLGVAWFRQPESAPAPTQLTLSLSNVPGNVRSTTSTWNSQLLREITPAT
ncbi:MAG: hypothetical protein HY567_01080 [Candidatus Kerfeldbacteria bacterium]|nr:hypothetical protein [Candidatus Kerfeldbacteria bacterium]